MLRWILSLLLLAAGTFVAFRVNILPFPGIPAGLRIVLSLEIIGLLITATLRNLESRLGTPAPAPQTKPGPVIALGGR